jgi:hypothetical protein
MQSQTILIVAIVVIAIIVLGLLAWMLTRRGERAGFEPRALSPEDLEGREQRIDEIERMFVSQPREAVAAARLLVDEMLTRMGYPVRLTSAERARDLAHFNRAHADRIRTAGAIRDDANTEEMRRALKGYLDTARDIVGEAQSRTGAREQPAVQEPAVQERAVASEGVGTEERRPVVDQGPAVEGAPPADDRPPPGERPATR